MKYELNEDLKNEIQMLLEQGRSTDPDCQRFGAEKHKYLLNPVISKEELDEILESCQFRLPEDFYWFLTNVGNGGAGPYYGIYPFSLEKKKWHTLSHLPVTYVTQEECDAINKDDVSDEEYDAFYDKAFSGMIYLAHEGCSGMICLIVQGEDFGKIIHMDNEFFGAPQFPKSVKPNTFINWYMGWLHEIALGYDARGYGFAINGSVEEIYEKFLQETDNEKRTSLLYGMKKGKGIEISQLMQPSGVDVLKLPEAIVQGLKKTAQEDDCTEVATTAANVLMYYGCEGWRDVVRFRLKHSPIGVNDWLLYQLEECCKYQLNYFPEVDEWYGDLLELILRSVRNGDVVDEDSCSAYRRAVKMVMHSSKYRFEDVKELLEYEEWEIASPVLITCSRLPIPREREVLFFEFARKHIDHFLRQKEHSFQECDYLSVVLCLARDVPKNASEGCNQRFYDYIKESLDELRQYFGTHDMSNVNQYITATCERVYEWLEIK